MHLLCGLMAAAIWLGAGLAQAADRSAPAAARQIFVVVDHSLTNGDDAALSRQLAQISEVMHKEFPRVLDRFARQGFKGEMLATAEAFKPGDGRYLLKVRITKYNAGSKAARLIVGFGAGGASLDCSYELSRDGRTALLASQTGSFSGREWRNAVRKVEETIVQAVVDHLERK